MWNNMCYRNNEYSLFMFEMFVDHLPWSEHCHIAVVRKQPGDRAYIRLLVIL